MKGNSAASFSFPSPFPILFLLSFPRLLLVPFLLPFPILLLLSFLPPAQAALYTWHSGRIYLACALKAAGASAGQIQALCRWVSEQSLHIYARMSETTYSYWLGRAMAADPLAGCWLYA